MTVEELEIIVTAKVEEALKEFMKIVPAIKQAMKQAQEAFSQIDTKKMTSKLHQAVNFMKKKMREFKKSTENNEIAIKVNNKEAQKQISQVQKQIDSLQEKINSRQLKLNIINPQIDSIVNNTKKEVTPEGIDPNSSVMDDIVNNSLSSNKEFVSLDNQAQKLYTEIEAYKQALNESKLKMKELNQEASNTTTTQEKMGGFFGTFKDKVEQVKPVIANIANKFKSLPKITQNITNHIKGMGNGLKQGVKHVLKYAMALFSLRGIYSVLSNSAQRWLSSQNSGAQQLSANIEYMKYAMGSVFAPVIESVINLVYQLMKAIQSLVYAFSGVNIFAKATASSMKSTAGSAKQTNKSLLGVHNEINNVSENNDSGNGVGTSPSMDLSQVDTQMSSLSQKLYNFFKPLVDSWNNYGTELVEQIKITAGRIGSLISSVWGSFENIIANGTAYSILENVLAIIGNIAEAFANAWNYNGNGDAIVQNLANAFNNLLIAINNVIQNPSFQNWLNWCSDKFREMSEKIENINWQPLINALMQIGTVVGTVAITILNGLVDIFKWLVENPIVSEIILAIAVAISIVTAALNVLSFVQGIVNAVMHASPITWIITGIVALIAVIILLVTNWDTVVKAISEGWEWIKQKAVEIWNAIADFFKNLWQGIKDTVMNVWNSIKDFFITYFTAVKLLFSTVWNGIKDVISNVWNTITNTISNVINGIKNTISNVLTVIKLVWENIWNGVKSTVENIWNGIWGTIKSVINSILGGIEGFVNGIVNGINVVLGGISSVANAVGGLIGLEPINLKLSTISLPRLAKGNVAFDETLAIFGEYSGASSNPEITAPQSIMYDTMKKALNDNNNDNNNGSINLAVYVGNTKLGQILLEDLRNMKRQTGKDIEVLVGG